MKPSKIDVIRAWKDPAYRASLSETDRAALPENPAGAIELTDAELGGVEGEIHLARYTATNVAWAAVQYNPSWVDGCPSSLAGCPNTFDAVRLTVTNPRTLIA